MERKLHQCEQNQCLYGHESSKRSHVSYSVSVQNNNNNSQIGIATSVRPGAVVTTTITTIVTQNPCQTVITSTSTSYTNSLKTAPPPTPPPPLAAVAASKAGTSFTNLTTCNPQYLRSMQSSSYHRRHSVSGTYWSLSLCVSLSHSFSLPYSTYCFFHSNTI